MTSLNFQKNENKNENKAAEIKKKMNDVILFHGLGSPYVPKSVDLCTK